MLLKMPTSIYYLELIPTIHLNYGIHFLLLYLSISRWKGKSSCNTMLNLFLYLFFPL